MRSDGVEAILIGGVGKRDLLAVGCAVREAALCRHRRSLGAGGTRRAALMRRDAVASFIAEKS